ncbi:hypothetical protein JVT61DRAFT_12393 [Boletus reticuloceps]|uniref:Uncharacterized protein n=1 Tax=Boletus reticuloceps TaxID=495285 RepID=A0A8I2YE61_9AGAM|nr:hypothetical protein JVT61DRAFT_12393 [Boletus reticuloceps]
MYDPFIDVSMAALESLRDLKVEGMRDYVAESDITFQRNDQKSITQNHGQATSYLKPDVVLIPSTRRSDRSASEELKNGTRARNRPKGSKEKPGLRWQDVLSVVEFKRSGKTMKGPRSEYAVSPTVDLATELSSCDIPLVTELSCDISPSGQSTSAKQTQSK